MNWSGNCRFVCVCVHVPCVRGRVADLFFMSPIRGRGRDAEAVLCYLRDAILTRWHFKKGRVGGCFDEYTS
jgi:hypothetical protein